MKKYLTIALGILCLITLCAMGVIGLVMSAHAANYNPTAGRYGNEFYTGSTGTQTVSATQMVGESIVPTVSKNVTSIQFASWDHSGSYVALTISLQSDSSGQPSGTTIVSSTYLPSAQFTWNSMAVSSTAVTAGTKYWVVITGETSTNSINMREIADPNGALGTTYQVETSPISPSWSAAGASQVGTVGFGYSDATYEGQGFVDFDSYTVTTAEPWGEQFKPKATTTVSAISAMMEKNGAGTPGDNLVVNLYNKDTSTLLATGTILTAASATQAMVWYTYSFGSNITLASGTNYQVYFSSASTGTNYMFLPPKTGNNGNGNALSYNGTNSVLEKNHTTLANDHDMAFYFTTVSAATTTAKRRRSIVINGN